MIACTILGPAFASLLCAQCVTGICAADSRAQAATPQSPPYTVTVSLDRRVVIPEEALTIELKGVKDNRCAVEVKCVWAGYAEITLQVGKAGADAALVVIGALPPAQAGTSPAATYGSYRFSLVGLEPGNSIAKPVEQSAYRATLQVSRVSG